MQYSTSRKSSQYFNYLKKGCKISSASIQGKANQFLEKYCLLTLGKAINLAKKDNLFPVTLDGIEAILEERNWLVHKFSHDYLDSVHITSVREGCINRIKTISGEAKRLQEVIETDLIAFSESVGIDMSRVRLLSPSMKRYSPNTHKIGA